MLPRLAVAHTGKGVGHVPVAAHLVSSTVAWRSAHHYLCGTRCGVRGSIAYSSRVRFALGHNGIHKRVQAAIKIVAALTGAQKPPAAAAGSATAGSVRVIPPALAASMERVIDSHRRATQFSRPSGELQPVAARDAPQLESPRPADRDIWQEVATGDEVAMRESFRRAARAIGPDIETPLVLGQGDAKVRPDLGVLPFTAEAMSAVWLKVRMRSTRTSWQET